MFYMFYAHIHNYTPPYDIEEGVVACPSIRFPDILIFYTNVNHVLHCEFRSDYFYESYSPYTSNILVKIQFFRLF